MTDPQPTSTAPQASQAQAPPAPQPASIPESRPFFSSQRAQRQLGLFFAGAGFFAITVLTTRRALVRRHKALIPKFFQPSNQVNDVNGAVEALEALSLATINVASAGIMVGGGLLYAFDVSSLGDIRRYVRRSIGADQPRTDQAVEKALEEWIARGLSIGVEGGRGGDKPKDEDSSTILETLSRLEQEKKEGRSEDTKRGN